MFSQVPAATWAATSSTGAGRLWTMRTAAICQHGRLTGEVKSALVCSPQHGIEVGDVIQFGRNHVLETRAAAG